MEAHEMASDLADRRALQISAQHPQRQGAGRMGKKRDMDNTVLDPKVDEDVAGNLSGAGKHKSPDARLKSLTGGRKKVSSKVLEEVGKEALKEHKQQHDALAEAELQGGMLSRHLREKYGDKHAEMFGMGFNNAMAPLKARTGGNVDLITGANDVGRVANPPPSFERNTVGMGVYSSRHRVGTMGGGEYFEGGGKKHDKSESESDEEKPTGKGVGATGGRKKRAPAGASDARRRRGQAVSRLMKEKGMTLGEASKHIKEHGY